MLEFIPTDIAFTVAFILRYFVKFKFGNDNFSLGGNHVYGRRRFFCISSFWLVITHLDNVACIAAIAAVATFALAVTQTAFFRYFLQSGSIQHCFLKAFLND